MSLVIKSFQFGLTVKHYGKAMDDVLVAKENVGMGVRASRHEFT